MLSKENKLTVNVISLFFLSLLFFSPRPHSPPPPPHVSPETKRQLAGAGGNTSGKTWSVEGFDTSIFARFASSRPKELPLGLRRCPLPYFPPFLHIFMSFSLLYTFVILCTILAQEFGKETVQISKFLEGRHSHIWLVSFP